MSNNLAEKFKQKIEQSEISKIPEAEIVSKSSTSQPIIQQVMTVEVPAGNPEILKNRHNESVKKYPELTLDGDEFVILSLRRHSIGYLSGIIFSAILSVFLISIWIIVCFMPNKFNIVETLKPQLSVIFGSITFLLLLISYINYIVYRANRFVATNERAIQWISNTIMNQKKQVINLESIEDISYTRQGILQHLFDYGTIRLSTIGEESTYTFPFTPNPDKKAEFLGDIVEAARENQMISEELYQTGQKMSVK